MYVCRTKLAQNLMEAEVKMERTNHLSSKISLHVFCKIKLICENGGEKGRSSKPPCPKVKVVLLNTVQVGDRCVLYFYLFIYFFTFNFSSLSSICLPLVIPSRH